MSSAALYSARDAVADVLVDAAPVSEGALKHGFGYAVGLKRCAFVVVGHDLHVERAHDVVVSLCCVTLQEAIYEFDVHGMPVTDG